MSNTHLNVETLLPAPEHASNLPLECQEFIRKQLVDFWSDSHGDRDPRPSRQRLDATRDSVTIHWTVGRVDLYITVGFYAQSNTPGEIFITAAKEGSTLGGLLDCIGVTMSMGLQHGVPWQIMSRKLRDRRFDPSDAESLSVVDALGKAMAYAVAYRSWWLTRDTRPKAQKLETGS